MTDVSVGFRPPCWCPSGWAPTWRLHTNLYKFGWHTSANSARIKTAETWFLARMFILQSSIISQILEFIYWTVTILVLITWLMKAENFQLSSRCSDIPMKHWLSCLIYYINSTKHNNSFISRHVIDKTQWAHPIARASLEYPVTCNYTRLLKQTTVLDKSGHDCGKFNNIKCNRIPTQRSIQKLFISSW